MEHQAEPPIVINLNPIKEKAISLQSLDRIPHEYFTEFIRDMNRYAMIMNTMLKMVIIHFDVPEPPASIINEIITQTDIMTYPEEIIWEFEKNPDLIIEYEKETVDYFRDMGFWLANSIHEIESAMSRKITPFRHFPSVEFQ